MTGAIMPRFRNYTYVIPSRELRYPTLGKGESFSNMPWMGICQFPVGYTSETWLEEWHSNQWSIYISVISKNCYPQQKSLEDIRPDSSCWPNEQTKLHHYRSHFPNCLESPDRRLDHNRVGSSGLMSEDVNVGHQHGETVFFFNVWGISHFFFKGDWSFSSCFFYSKGFESEYMCCL